MPLSAPEYWLESTKNYFICQFTHVGELNHKETWSAASFGWAEGLQTINPPIYRLTTAVSDIDQTNINRDIRDGNWLSTLTSSSLTQGTCTSTWSTWPCSMQPMSLTYVKLIFLLRPLFETIYWFNGFNGIKVKLAKSNILLIAMVKVLQGCSTVQKYKRKKFKLGSGHW